MELRQEFRTLRKGLISTCLLLLLSLCLCISFLPVNNGHALSVQSRHRSRRSQTIQFSQFNVDSPEVGIPVDLPVTLDRQKRDVDTTNSSTTKKPIAVTVTNLQDTHNQLVVYWAGLDVIICLARDSKSISPSALHISTDYGSNFSDVSSQLVVDEGNSTSFATLDKFFNHPKSNGRFIFTDVRNKLIFTTTNYGAKFVKIRLDFTPDEVSFDPNSDETILAYETSTKERRLFVSLDYGINWKLVEESVKSLAWDESVVPTTLYLGRAEPNNEVTLMSSPSLFLDPAEKEVVLTGIEEFDLKDSYIFATKRKSNGDLQLLVSYKRGKFVEALFPTGLPSQHFHIADVSSGQMFISVTHNETVTNLYIGNEPADINEPPKFTLSLERIVFFKPNLTWSGSWLNDVTEHPFVELHHIEGLRGVYIASQFKSAAVSNPTKKFGLEHIQSVITYDQGGVWSPLHTPDVDNDGEPIYCKLTSNYTKVNCSLHISQRVSELYPVTRAVPILSQKSSIGLVMATGTVDNSLKGHLGVFMSTDGAAHWKQILKGNYLYNFGDHGGLIVAVKYYRMRDLTNTLIYSTDEGNSWETYQFYEKGIRVLGLMTEPGENTTVFFIFGSDSVDTNTKHSWVLIKVDFKNIFDRQCKAEDYKEWSPTDSQPGTRHCLLGQTDLYERRRPNVSCYNGASYTRHIRSKACLCKRTDFECDFGYKEVDSDEKLRCVKDTSETSVGVKSEWCKPGDSYYNRTKGYRKIPGDVCEGGEADTYLPTSVACAVRNESEFMIVAKRDSVLRIDLNDFTRVEVLPLGNVRSVVAIDYDMKNNCIYWSDVNKDHIMRLHLDGASTPELLVSEDLKSVEGLAFDWMAQNLYFVDGTLKNIEVIKTDVSILGRLRKVILGPDVLDKPRGIAIHPGKGYLFWTDWSNTTPYIGRSGLDGSNPQRIVTNPDETLSTKTVRWPNGIAVDVAKDLIYWVDASTDTIYTADLNGKNVKAFLVNEVGVSHPFAVGVYKNFVYWDDWTTRSIYATRTDTPTPKDVMITIQSNLSRLMDLKVYGLHSQTGTNQCSVSNGSCKHLCLARPNNTETCACPDGLTMTNGECLCPDGKPVENGTCVSNCNYTGAFACKSGFCILPRWRCDGQPDCGPGDASDEENCETENTCAENQFRCVADGKCIPIHWACDLDIDCEADGSDELGCAYSNACDSPDHFQCNNRQCISSKWRCDGEDDCGDSSDEQNCTATLSPNGCKVDEFQCADKRCISIAWACDGDLDCLDGSDEKNCTGNKCPNWKFQCGSGECIRNSWLCDGDFDCADHSDETNSNCTSSDGIVPPAPPAGSMFGNCSEMEQMFQCAGADSLCIPKFWVNDGIKDCPEGDDELDEGEDTKASSVTVRPQTKTCPDNHFQCNSTGECLYETKFCDGITDCPDGSDELPSCDSFFEKDCPKGFLKCGLSSICIRAEKLYDDVVDCPNRFDARSNTTIFREDCNMGQFRCDVDICLPLYQFCDNNGNCMDGSDELADVCKKHKPVYQVAGISVEQLEDYSTFIEWWLPSSATGQLEFLPSYCEVVSHICQNATSWTKQRRYELPSDATKRFTNYSATVYVRRADEIYPPAVYTHFLTLEGGSSPPYNLTVYQPDVFNLCVTWNRPLTPNGDITKYSVYFTPPTPAVSVVSLTEKLCISNKKLNPDFVPGTNYSFWVTATNGFNTTKPSKTVSYIFHNDVAEVENANVRASSESVVTLEWNVTSKNVTDYEITYQNQGGSFQFLTKVFSKTNWITIDKLPPGTKFRYTIVPLNYKMAGVPFKGIFATTGKALPKVEGLKATLSPKNVVTVTWSPVVDDRSKSWKYSVVYGKSVSEVVSRELQIETKEPKTFLKQLEACETYFIAVSLVGPNGGIGPASPAKQVRTAMDEKAPPKNLRVAGGGTNASVYLNWDAPCPVVNDPIKYNLNFREVNLNHTFGSTEVVQSNKSKLNYTIKNPYGGHYEVTVSTSVSGARPSKPAMFDGIPIPHVMMLFSCSACNVPTVYWEPPMVPKPVSLKGNVSYVVWLSPDESFTKAKPFYTTENSMKFDGIEKDHIYYVAVSVRDAEGLESILSPHISLENLDTTPPSQISMSETNLVGIIIAVVVVISLLVAALGVFFVRHRRLQVSFLNFASSHYSTSSGAAVFQHSVEDEMDSPVIRGFSDDEPLLVA